MNEFSQDNMLKVKLCDSPESCKEGNCGCEEVEIDVSDAIFCLDCHCDDPGNCVNYDPQSDCCRLESQDWAVDWEDDSEG